MDEQRAIRLCLRHRDPVGFEFLVKHYRREAFCHALALLGNQEDAADACQESFGRAFAALPRLVELDRFYPWFYRILRNCCLNMLGRRKTVLDYVQGSRSDPAGAEVPADPSVILVQREEQRAVWRTLVDLPPAFREILALKYIQGHNYEEIATLLGIPRGTVMSRLFHARQAFRQKYVEQDKPDTHKPNPPSRKEATP